MTATHETLAALPRAVRTVDRWGLLAGVTSVLANVVASAAEPWEVT